MNERSYLDVISRRRRGAVAGLIRGGLSLMTPFYRAGVSVRNRLFDLGIQQTHHAGVPIVSVGNITTGGTGKTPLVAWLADWCRTHDRKPCLVSRGYRSFDEGGNDEQRVLQQLCPGVPHEQDRDRVAAAQRAIELHEPDVLILDDGFQHRRLARDLDVVLIDALNPWGYGRLLPRGLLREPQLSLGRADVVIITRADQIDDAERSRLRTEIERFTPAPIAEAVFRPQSLIDVHGNTAELASLNGETLLGFCGIGNPDGFRRTLADAGYVDVPLEAFPDHHHYTIDDLRRLEANSNTHRAAALVTTQKDLVKLDSAWITMPVWAVVIGAEIAHGADEFDARLCGLLS